MHAQQQARTVGERAFVIGERGAIGGAHFAEYRAAFRHDVGNAEGFADLDQLAAGDEGFASASERGQNQKNRGGIVVDDDSRFRAREAAEERGGVDVAAAAGAGLRDRIRDWCSRRRWLECARARWVEGERGPGWCAG